MSLPSVLPTSTTGPTLISCWSLCLPYSLCTFLFASIMSTAQKESKYRQKRILITFVHGFIWVCRSKLHMENWFAHKLTAHFQDFLHALYCVERLQLDKQSNLQSTSGSTTSFVQAVSCQHPLTLLLSFLVRKLGGEGGKCFSLSHVLLHFSQSSLITREWGSLWHRNWHSDPPHSPYVGDGNCFLKEDLF